MKTSFTFSQFFLIIYLLIFPATNNAQEIDAGKIVRDRLISCQEIAFTTTSLLMEFHRKQQIDTIHSLLYYWESNCGMQEPMMRYLVLHMINTNTFYQDWYPEDLFVLLEDYRVLHESPDYENLYYDYNFRNYYALSPGFNNFTNELARELKKSTDISASEEFFLEYYSNNFKRATEMLNSGELEGTRLDSLYTLKNAAILNQREAFLNFSASLWMPPSNLRSLGTRPEVGVGFEIRKSNIMFNAWVNVSFGSTGSEYYVVAHNQLYSTNTYLGMGLGADLGIALSRDYNTGFYLLPGVSYRFFETLNTQPEHSDLPSRSIGSFSPNIGLYLSHRYSTTGLIGFQIRYNFVNFKNPGGTDLSGNLITAGLVFGFGQ